MQFFSVNKYRKLTLTLYVSPNLLSSIEEVGYFTIIAVNYHKFTEWEGTKTYSVISGLWEEDKLKVPQLNKEGSWKLLWREKKRIVIGVSSI